MIPKSLKRDEDVGICCCSQYSLRRRLISILYHQYWEIFKGFSTDPQTFVFMRGSLRSEILRSLAQTKKLRVKRSRVCRAVCRNLLKDGTMVVLWLSDKTDRRENLRFL